MFTVRVFTIDGTFGANSKHDDYDEALEIFNDNVKNDNVGKMVYQLVDSNGSVLQEHIS